MDNITLLIADDHPIFRLGLINLVQKNSQYKVIAQTSNGTEALALIEKHKPHIAILDIEMPGMNGLDVCDQIRVRNLETMVLFVTFHKEIDLYNRAKDLGANGYLLKENAINDVEIAIEALLKHGTYFDINIESTLTTYKKSLLANSETQKLLDKLTKTEKDILLFIAKQISTKDIAEKLFVSEKTIKNHRHNIIGKLELAGEQNALLKFAIEHAEYLM